MKYFKRYILITFLFLGCVFTTQAQKIKNLSGKVLDSAGNPLSGVVVSGDEGSVRSFSEEDGTFNITVKKSQFVVFELDSYQPKTLNVNDVIAQPAIVLDPVVFLAGQSNKITIPFGKIEKRRIVGDVTSIDVEDGLTYDSRQSVGSALYGKVPGLMNNFDVLGLGNATIVVDGIPRTNTDFNLSEVAEITVLKDALSRMMYGSAADKGVILITTKRGQALKKDMRVFGEYGISVPKATPDYLGSADYMKVYNQALINDGKAPKYSQDVIDATIAGTDPVRYPDEDYYSNRYVKDYVSYSNFYAEASGGNTNAQYYVNVGWKHNEGWMNKGTEKTDVLNVRGNVDYQIRDNLKMSIDAVAVFDLYEAPNVVNVNDHGYITADFWDRLSTSLPNSFPVLIPQDGVANVEVLDAARFVDGNYLLGGNSVYQRSLYGDMALRGNREQQNRTLQFNTALDWDLSSVTQGLKARGYLTFDFYNRFITVQNQEYAVYNPVYDEAGNMTVEVIGKDTPSSKVNVSEDEAYFQRRIGAYLTLDYDRVFGDHAISATALGYRQQLTIPYDESNSNHNVYQQDFKNLHFGLRANYMYKEKYLAEFGGTLLGTQKLDKGDRYAFAPSLGLGWIMSQEDFLSDSENIDYLKVRASYGILKNDNWDNYFLYQTAFNKGGWFNYANTAGNKGIRNQELNYTTVINDISWQTRREFNIGFESLLFDKHLWAEASYFNSASVDNVTEMKNLYPDIIGAVSRYANFNSYNDQGFELGLKYTGNVDDLKLTVGSNMVYSKPKITKMDEPFYAEDAQYRYKEGTVTDGMWGWQADGLYAESDFDLNGNLVTGLPTPTFGSVQAGDIKYKDLNGDTVIDEDDQTLIGNNSARFQYSLNLRLEYKNFDLYVLGVGQTGQERLRNNSYYWTYGEMKYGANALEAYGPDNKDVNALMPRLSSTKNNNNYRNSTYWKYKSSWFTLPTVQLTYHFKTKPTSALKGWSTYLRASDLVRIDSNKEYNELNVKAAPQTRSFAVGVVASF